jgi:hypothetical protein
LLELGLLGGGEGEEGGEVSVMGDEGSAARPRGVYDGLMGGSGKEGKVSG